MSFSKILCKTFLKEALDHKFYNIKKINGQSEKVRTIYSPLLDIWEKKKKKG